MSANPSLDPSMDLNKFMGTIIRIFRVDRFNIDIDHQAETPKRVVVQVSGVTLEATDKPLLFHGQGITLGHALSACLHEINQHFGRED